MSIIQRLPLLRAGLEAVARGKKVKRRLPCGIKIYVSPDSQLKYMGRTFDTDLTSIARERITSESVVWDIGANCGVLAFSSAVAKQVVAVEADPFLCHIMQESMAMNRVPLVLVNAAVSSQLGLAEFSIAQRGRALNRLSSIGLGSQIGGERFRILVPTITLDSLLDATLPPTFVKIDVEGAEIEVLAGATRLLTSVRPLLYIETFDETHAACEAILQKAGYTLTKAAEMNWICTPV